MNNTSQKMLRFIALLLMVHHGHGFGLLGEKDGYFQLRTTLQKSLNNLSIQPTVNESYIVQPLDHFDRNEKRTWSMRYFQRLDFFQPDGPVFIFIGGENEASKSYLKGGLITKLAQETGGALFGSEHRYYGESIPLDITHLDNLKYLSSVQALADLAELVKMIKSLPDFKNSKVVMVGGSYAGNLAVWFRQKYPELADAAVASSAPVQAQLDFFSYLETVGKDYKRYGPPGCYQAIIKLFKHYLQCFKTPDGIQQLKTNFSVCEETDLTKPENQQCLFQVILYSFELNSQYGGEKKMTEHCKQIMSGWNVQTDLGSKKCAHGEIFQNNSDEICKNCTFPGGFPLSMWSYQTCAEFGYYATTSSKMQPFQHFLPLEYFYNLCSVSFGFSKESIESAVRRTNDEYGGLSPNVTRVVFTHGAADPWRCLGVRRDLNREAPAMVTPNAFHCEDLGDSYRKEVVKTQKFIKDTIKKWIGLC